MIAKALGLLLSTLLDTAMSLQHGWLKERVCTQRLAQVAMLPIFFPVLNLQQATVLYLLASSGTAFAASTVGNTWSKHRLTSRASTRNVAAKPTTAHVSKTEGVKSGVGTSNGASSSSASSPAAAAGMRVDRKQGVGPAVDAHLNECILQRHHGNAGVHPKLVPHRTRAA